VAVYTWCVTTARRWPGEAGLEAACTLTTLQ